MINKRIRHVDTAPTCSLRTPSEIDVLVIGKETLMEAAEFI